jgi:hypothetical protein
MKLEKPAVLFNLNDKGGLTHVRGEEMPKSGGFMFVLSEQESTAPSRETSWALRGAYRFVQRLQIVEDKG